MNCALNVKPSLSKKRLAGGEILDAGEALFFRRRELCQFGHAPVDQVENSRIPAPVRPNQRHDRPQSIHCQRLEPEVEEGPIQIQRVNPHRGTLTEATKYRRGARRSATGRKAG